jgi:hypothetical protein
MLDAAALKKPDVVPDLAIVHQGPARRYIVLAGYSRSSGDVYSLDGTLTLEPSGELSGSILWTVVSARRWPRGMCGEEGVVGHATASGLCFTGVSITGSFVKEDYELALISGAPSYGWFWGRSDAWRRGRYDARLNGTYQILDVEP